MSEKTDLGRLTDQFLEVEQRYDLHRRFYSEDLPLWMLLRFPVWGSVILVHRMGYSDSGPTYRKSSFSIKLNYLWQFLKKMRHDLTAFRSGTHDILAFDAVPRAWGPGYYFDIYYHYLLEQLTNHKTIAFISPGLPDHRPLKFDTVRHLDLISIKVLMHKYFMRNDRKIIRDIREILTIMAREFGLDINIPQIASDFYTDKVLTFQAYLHFLRRAIPRIRPKIILERTHYSVKCMALNRAAYEHNIPTIEFQHGIINRYSINYNYENLNSDAGCSYLPRHLFLFGEFWRKNARFPEKSVVIRATGFPHFEASLRKYPPSGLTQHRILFISQRTIAKGLARLAAELQQLLPGGYQILYKLHPAERLDWKKELGAILADPNITVLDGSEPESIYQIMSRCEVQIGVYSTAIFEGLGFGLKTIIAKLPGHEYMNDLLERGYAHLAERPEACCDLILHTSAGQSRTGDDIWKSDSLKHMKDAIHEILYTPKPGNLGTR